MTTYRYDIGLSKYLYGTELEFTQAPLEDLIEVFKKTEIPIRLERNHKDSDTIYDINYLDEDSTVSIPKNGKMYGGEVSSRLYKNAKEDWLEIEMICKVLKENGAQINSFCSNHVSINISPVKNINIFVETLIKILYLAEQDINMFYMGDCYFERKTKESYARLIRPYLMEKIKTVDFETEQNVFASLFHKGYSVFERRDAINFRDYYYNRMEFRYANGTLNAKTIQNNINFSLKLVDAIVEGKFDLEKLTNEVFRCSSNNMDYKRFQQLVDIISTSSNDQNDFMSQYEKVLSTKPKNR